MCRPVSSVRSNNSNANKTMVQAVFPFLKKTVYIEEFVPLGMEKNAHVDRRAMTEAARGENGKAWMSANYVGRLHAVRAMRDALGLPTTVVWVGGPVAGAALQTGGYLDGGVDVSRDHGVTEHEDGRCINVRGSQHPSAPILAGDNPGVDRCRAAALRSGGGVEGMLEADVAADWEPWQVGHRQKRARHPGCGRRHRPRRRRAAEAAEHRRAPRRAGQSGPRPAESKPGVARRDHRRGRGGTCEGNAAVNLARGLRWRGCVHARGLAALHEEDVAGAGLCCATRDSVAGGCAIKGLWDMLGDASLTPDERVALLCGCLITETQLSALSAMRAWMAPAELRKLFSSFASFRAACRLEEFPGTLRKLLADAATAPLVKELIKHDGGIKRLTENDGWLEVSAPQS